MRKGRYLSLVLVVCLLSALGVLLSEAEAQAGVGTSASTNETQTSPPSVTLRCNTVVKVKRTLKVEIKMNSIDTSMAPQAVIDTQSYSVKRGKWGKSTLKKVDLPTTRPTIQTKAKLSFSRRGPKRVRLRYRFAPDGKYQTTPWVTVTACGPKVIALTFDDGPDKRDTPVALKALRRYQARATFFMVGHRVAKSPGLAAQACAEGHQLGNHSWRHVRAPSLTSAQFKTSVMKTNKAIKRALKEAKPARVKNRYPIVYRYPWGDGNARTDSVLRDLGMRPYGWHYATGDGGSHGPRSRFVTDLIARKVIDNARPGQIVLMHDGQDRPNTVAALPRILKTLSARGYDFVTVSDLKTLRGK